MKARRCRRPPPPPARCDPGCRSSGQTPAGPCVCSTCASVSAGAVLCARKRVICRVGERENGACMSVHPSPPCSAPPRPHTRAQAGPWCARAPGRGCGRGGRSPCAPAARSAWPGSRWPPAGRRALHGGCRWAGGWVGGCEQGWRGRMREGTRPHNLAGTPSQAHARTPPTRAHARRDLVHERQQLVGGGARKRARHARVDVARGAQPKPQLHQSEHHLVWS